MGYGLWVMGYVLGFELSGGRLWLCMVMARVRVMIKRLKFRRPELNFVAVV